MFRSGIATLVSALIFILLLMMPVMAFAQDGPVEAQNALQRITDIAFQILSPLAILFATFLVHKIVKLVEKKTGIDVPAAQEMMIDGWVEEGIHYAEEKSRSKLKGKEARLTGPEKLEHAADFVLSFIESKQYPEWSKNLIKAKLEAKLGIKRFMGEKPELDKEDDESAV